MHSPLSTHMSLVAKLHMLYLLPFFLGSISANGQAHFLETTGQLEMKLLKIYCIMSVELICYKN